MHNYMFMQANAHLGYVSTVSVDSNKRGDWKCRTGIKWTNQIWGLENAGLELKGPSRKTGKCRTGIKRTK